MSTVTPSVALVTNQVDKVGGLERYVLELAAGLSERGTNVTVIAKQTTGEPQAAPDSAGGASIVRTWVPSKRHFWFAPAYAIGVPISAQRAISRARGRAALVHGHFFAPMLGPALCRLPYAYTCHGLVHTELLDERLDTYALPDQLQSVAVRAVREAERFVMGQAEKITTLSEYMAGEVRKLVGASASVTVIPGGVDTTRFSPGSAEVPMWAQGRFPVLLSTRRLAQGKGVLQLVQSMPAVLAAYPKALLLVAGSGSEESEIRRFINSEGIAGSVSLLGDVAGDRLVNLIRCADACIVPSQRPEPFGLSTVESLACGTPVLGTPVGANVELLEPLHPTLVLSGLKPDQIAAGICSAFATPSVLQDVRLRARAYVHPRFSWGSVVDRWMGFYADMREPIA